MTVKVRKFQTKCINFLLIVFLTHGILYFFSPYDIYNTNSPIKYIKYLILCFIVLLSIVFCKSKEISTYLIFSFSLLILNVISTYKEFSIIGLINYIFPFITFFIYRGFNRKIKINLVVIITYLTCSICAYIEFFVLKNHFTRFSTSGYRVISIFVNPNNCGLMMIILTFFLLFSHSIKNKHKFIIFMNSVIILMFTGSRTSQIIFLLIIIINSSYAINKGLRIAYAINKNIIYVTLLFIFFLCIFTIIAIITNANFLDYFTSKLRLLESITISGNARFEQYRNFFKQTLANPIFPWQDNIAYVDNIYLHIWGMFGLPGFLGFFLFNINLINIALRKVLKKEICYLIIFYIAGLTTNIFYLWPLAYVYWYLAAYIIINKNLCTKGEFNCGK